MFSQSLGALSDRFAVVACAASENHTSRICTHGDETSRLRTPKNTGQKQRQKNEYPTTPNTPPSDKPRQPERKTPDIHAHPSTISQKRHPLQRATTTIHEHSHPAALKKEYIQKTDTHNNKSWPCAMKKLKRNIFQICV